MKTAFLSLISGLLLASFVAAPAHARHGDDGPSGPEAQRRETAREQARERRREQLSPEERRELRRDIRDFGRDIYRPEDSRRRSQDR